MTEQTDLGTVSRAFVAAAFDVLAQEHVIPTPVYHPYVAVGRDYVGGSIMGLPEFKVLEAHLNQAYPERFADPLTRAHPEFATTYIFSFLEACVTRCARESSFDSASSAVHESIDELRSVLEKPSHEIVCCRHVSHLTTADGREVQIGDITVVPEPEGDFDTLRNRFQHEISAAPRAWNRRTGSAFAFVRRSHRDSSGRSTGCATRADRTTTR